MNSQRFYYIKFRTTHHQEKSRAVHNSLTWINNETGEPCGLNPCEVCIERKQLGLKTETVIHYKEECHA